MKPMNIKPKRFPGKTDCHPKSGFINWWEEENDNGNKKSERFDVSKEIKKELNDYLTINKK